MYKAHLFICTNGKDAAGKCGSKNAEELQKATKMLAKGKPWADEVRINKAGCLNQCESGIACVLYPQNEWALNKTADSAPELIELIETHLRSGK